jgi:hypothetical protein
MRAEKSWGSLSMRAKNFHYAGQDDLNTARIVFWRG